MDLDGWFGLLLAFGLLAGLVALAVGAFAVAGPVGGLLLIGAAAVAFVMWSRSTRHKPGPTS